MGDKKNMSQASTDSLESQVGECKSLWFISGPPFDQRDYMMSPSESTCSVANEKELPPPKKTKLKASDVKVDEKYILTSRGALKKLVELINGDCIQPFIVRMKELIHNFLRGSCGGYLVDDIPSIVEIVEYFSRNRDSIPEFSEFVKLMLSPAKNPPLQEKSSDVLRSKNILTDYFTLLGELAAAFQEDCFQFQLLEILECLLFRRKLSGISAVKLSVCHKAMEESQLSYVVAVLMESIPNKLYTRYLEIAVNIILVSAKAGYTMLRNNLLHIALWRLNSYNCDSNYFTGEFPGTFEEETQLKEYYSYLEKSGYLIWGLLSVIPKCDRDIPCPGEKALWSLRNVFQHETKKKSQKAFDARNNMAGIIVKLCGVFEGELPVFQTGLAVDIAILATATENGTKDTWLSGHNFGSSKEDYNLKQLMLLCCGLLARNKSSLEVLKAFKVIEGILCLIDSKMTTSWIPSQLVNLFRSAFRILSELVPVLPEVYVLSQGNAKLLLATTWFMEEHFDQKSLLALLRTLCVLVTCEKSRCIIDDLLARDGIKFIMELCRYLLNLKRMKSIDQRNLTRVFTILESLLKNRPDVLETYGESSAVLSVTFLKRILDNSSCDSKWEPNLLLSFGGFMWEAIAWSQTASKTLIGQGGVFLLLDLIEVSSFPLQMLYLGILVDIADRGSGIAHLLTWRGKSNFGILDLMIDIWRTEECITKVHRTKDGIIQDIDAPLMTEEQWFLTHQVQGSHIYSPSITEMICSARPKIHAIYRFLQERYSTLTNICESSYKLRLKETRSAYQVYVPLIEHYFSLKMGEIWFEVLRDANISGVIPTAFDGNAMSSLLEEKISWAARIKTMQEETQLLQQGNGIAQEKQLYDLIRAHQLPSALEAMNELDYVLRTSQRMFQARRKEKQLQDVENSFAALTSSLPSDVKIHRTFLGKTKATCVFGNYITIKSEKESTENEDIEIVSSESSEENPFDSVDKF